MIFDSVRVICLWLLLDTIVWGLSGDSYGRSNHPSFHFEDGFAVGTVVGTGEEDEQKDFRRSSNRWLQYHRQKLEEHYMLRQGRFVSLKSLTEAQAFEGLSSGENDKRKTVLASRSASIWPPWPLSILQRSKESNRPSTHPATPSPIDGSLDRGKRTTSHQYPSMALLMFSYLRQRTRIWMRQLEEIGSQIWFNLPPATPPLILLASIPQKIVTKDLSTGEEVTKRIFPVFSNPLARSMIFFGLGMAVLSWSQQELKRKRKLAPLPLSIRYESVSRVFLPPFLPEDVHEPELEALDKVVAASIASGNKVFAEENEGNNMLSKVSPKIRKHLNYLYETASNPQKNIHYYLEEWKRGRMARKREMAKIRRLRIFDELVALQALKRNTARSHKVNSTKDSDNCFALVTGASEGIGRAIAVELARWEIPLVLVARNVDKLISLAYDLEACYGVQCCVLCADLSKIDAAEKIYEVTTKAGLTVDILVNNAGIAFEGLTVDMTPFDVERMVVLNAVTYAKLSQLYGQDMKRRRRGRMLMISSMAGLCNGAPNMAVYGATKAFGKSLSLAMAKEMEPFGVGVTCLLPGAVAGTQFRATSGTERALCWSMPFYPRSPESVAHQGIISVLDGDSQTIPGWQNRLFATIIRPIIPQRFEIMTVQAAFSPLRLPSIQDLFRRDSSDDIFEEEIGDSTPPCRPQSNAEGNWRNLQLDPRYETQPLPRILKLPGPEDENKRKEEQKSDEKDQSQEHLAIENDIATTPDPNVPLTNNATTLNSSSVKDTIEIESEVCGSTVLNSPANQTHKQVEPDLKPKQKIVTTVEVEDDIKVIVEKESENATFMRNRPLQTKIDNEESSVIDPDQGKTKADETGDGGEDVYQKSKFWDDEEGNPFSPKFWSDEVDALFSPNLFSGGSLIKSFQVSRELLCRMLSSVMDRPKKNLVHGPTHEAGMLSAIPQRSCTSKLTVPNTARSNVLGHRNQHPPKFTLPRAFVMLFTSGRCFSASNNIFFQGQCTSYQCGTQNSRTTPSCSSLVKSFKYGNDASDFSSSLATTKNVVPLKDTPADRPHNVKFVAPLLDYGYPPAVDCLMHQQDAARNVPEREEDVRKPILLYLPGFDGTYICPFLQFPELGTEFEVWCMTVGMKDRSTYQELKAIVLDFIKKDLDHDGRDVQQLSDTIPIIDGESSSETFDASKDVSGIFRGMFGGGNLSAPQKIKHSRRRPIYLAGESFGGILASDVALTLLTKKRNSRIALDERGQQAVNLQGLVLINPATCYDRSQLALKGPQVSKMPKPLYLMGLFSQLLPLFTDEHSVSQLGLILQGKALPSVIDNPQREAYMGRVAISLPSKLEFMPPDTLAWRLEKWLETGCSQMRESTFKLFPKFRTLIVVGEKDKTLPSIAEAERLTNKVLLPSQTKVHVVEGAGHASTCGSRLDLAAVMRNNFIELQKPNKKQNQQSKQEKNQTEAQSMKKEKRTSMKEAAEVGTGPFFGMEERYDKAKIGLNPILYWSKSNYTPVQLQIEDRLVTMPGSKQVSYKKANYKVPK